MKTSPSNAFPPDEYSLNRIKGIGPTRQQQLQTLLAIATVIDLAEASAAAIEAAFREAGYPIPRSNASGWIAQARQLLAVEAQHPIDIQAHRVDESLPSTSKPQSAGEPGAHAEATIPENPEEWCTQASVRLEFQTQGGESAHRWRLFNPATEAERVLTDQPQDTHQTWLQHLGHIVFHLHEGEGSESLQAWLQRQIIGPPKKTHIEKSEASPFDLTVAVRQVMLLQPPENPLPIVAMAGNTGFSGALQANQPFQVGVCLDFPALGTWALPANLSYSLESSVKSLAYPHRTIPLGKSSPHRLTSGQTQYKTIIATNALPAGLYRLQILIECQGANLSLNIHEVSRLQVI